MEVNIETGTTTADKILLCSWDHLFIFKNKKLITRWVFCLRLLQLFLDRIPLIKRHNGNFRATPCSPMTYSLHLKLVGKLNFYIIIWVISKMCSLVHMADNLRGESIKISFFPNWRGRIPNQSLLVHKKDYRRRTVVRWQTVVLLKFAHLADKHGWTCRISVTITAFA